MGIVEIIDRLVDDIIPGPDLLNHTTVEEDQEQWELHKRLAKEERESGNVDPTVNQPLDK